SLIAILRRPSEVPIVPLDLIGRGAAGENQDAVAERGGLPRAEPEVELLLAVGERFPAQRVGGEQTVAASVPVRGEADVVRMIPDGQCDRLARYDAGQHRPAAARAPDGVALEPLGTLVAAGDAGVVEHRPPAPAPR